MSTAFDPIVLGGRRLAGRIVMAPMTRSRAYGPGAEPAELMATYYAQRATAGLIVTEAVEEFAAASGWLQSIWLLVAIPLASAAVLLVLGKRADKWGHWLGVLSVVACFVLGLTYFVALRDLPAFDARVLGGQRVERDREPAELLGVYYHLGQCYEELGEPGHNLDRDGIAAMISTGVRNDWNQPTTST